MFLVVGATGYVGGMVARGLLAEGYSVRALVREGSSRLSLEGAGAQAAMGDLGDPASLMVACQGVKAVIATAGARTPDYDRSALASDVRGYRNLIRAGQVAGVDHFTFVSALGADPHSPVPYLAAKGQIEADLRTSRITYTILQPSYFMDFWFAGLVLAPATQGQPVWVLDEGKDPHWPVAAQDVAEFVIMVAGGQRSVRDWVIAITGPEPLSLRDAALVAARMLRRPVSVKTFDPSTPPPGLSPLIVQLMQVKLAGEVAGDTTATEFGIKLTTLDDYLNKMLASAAKT